ncbi:MAG: ABC transporter ATP-binding protein [Planctomycetes bacterium]|nr:ABC transporter ATP-binding protein [Planctomycetota bacterium]
MAPFDAELLLSCRDLVAGHGRTAVLRDVTLQVRAGEFWFLLGTNATGKSTLLATLLGVLPPLRGVAGYGPGSGCAELGYVPQRCELAQNLPTTAHELVALGLVGLPLSRAERDERVADALGQVGLREQAHRSYWSMSGGQRQRVIVARALARRPRLLCVDEPMSHLDLVTERALLELFARRNREEGLAIVYVSHDVAVAAALATHVALVHHGGLEAGPADALLDAAKLEQAYGAPVPVAPIPGFERTRPRLLPIGGAS